jgi:hypothetical protein
MGIKQGNLFNKGNTLTPPNNQKVNEVIRVEYPFGETETNQERLIKAFKDNYEWAESHGHCHLKNSHYAYRPQDKEKKNPFRICDKCKEPPSRKIRGL